MTTAEFLAEWMVRSSILIAVGALLLWLFRVKDASIRGAAWTAMLCGSLLIPALALAFPKTTLPRIRRTAAGMVVQQAEAPVALSKPAPSPAPATISPESQYARTERPEPPVSDPLGWMHVDWPKAVLIFYAGICGVMLLRLCAGLWAGLRLFNRSRLTGDPIGGIEIRESGDLAAPLTLGLVRPAIVLPADWQEWDGTRLEAVLAHERSHIQRGDPWAQLLSGIHRALLWASPLSWFLHRRIVETAEEASDDAAVAAIEDRVSYAETLLDFMQRGVWNSGFVGVPMARHGSPEKRIRRVLNSSGLSRGVTGRGVAAIVALVSPLAYVIATAQTRPQFEIADVHAMPPTAANLPAYGGPMRDGMYSLRSATMLDLIKTAYGVEAEQVVGGPSWLELDRFEVFAKRPASSSADTTNLMLQALLADRFKLAIRRDMHPLPGFALKVGKGAAPKLKKSDGSGSSGCKWTRDRNDKEMFARRDALIQEGHTNPVLLMTFRYTCQNMSMAAFAEGMRRMVNVQQDLGTGAVVDQTGLSGQWDFNFKYTTAPRVAPGADIDGEVITVFDAMEKQLGLKLETARIPTPVLVVDSVNRKPSKNPPDVKAILSPPPPAAFEVADLRPSAPDAPEVGSPGPMSGGRFEVRNFSLIWLIRIAWSLPSDDALKGKPTWLDYSVRVDVNGKLPSTESTRSMAGGGADMDAFVPALKTLLTERYKIAIHTERQPVLGYALVAARPKMRTADPSLRTKCFEGPGVDGKDPRTSNPLLTRLVTCQNISMQEFAEELPGRSGAELRNQVVVDATGLDGAYDFTLSFTPPANGPAAADPSGPTLFEAIEKQLGLKLEKRDIPAQVYVLDHIEQKPEGN